MGFSCLYDVPKPLLDAGIPVPTWVIASLIVSIILGILFLILYFANVIDYGIFKMFKIWLYVSFVFTGLTIILICGKTSAGVIALASGFIVYGLVELNNMFQLINIKFNWWESILVALGGILGGLLIGLTIRPLGRSLFCEKDVITKERCTNVISEKTDDIINACKKNVELYKEKVKELQNNLNKERENYNTLANNLAKK